MGHTAAIHTQDAAAAREFGVAVPAFRVCVNTASTHGSVGYSTNLFPAMTLGCGSQGGNITSDNIGPKHLMNLRRVAWESRAVDHRTIPAAQRMEALGGAASGESGHVAAAAAPVANPKPAPGTVPDRAVIAHAVEHVMAHLGIPRGAGSVAGGATQATLPGKSSGAKLGSGGVPAPTSVSAFVSEGDVRLAVTRGEKIFIGPKTILTPSARDVAGADEVLVETNIVPPASKSISSSE